MPDLIVEAEGAEAEVSGSTRQQLQRPAIANVQISGMQNVGLNGISTACNMQRNKNTKCVYLMALNVLCLPEVQVLIKDSKVSVQEMHNCHACAQCPLNARKPAAQYVEP